MNDENGTGSLKGKYGKVGRPPKSAYSIADQVMDLTEGQAGEGKSETVVIEEETLAIGDRFAALEDMAYGVAAQHYRAMIVSGQPGTGKTYGLEKVLKAQRAIGTISKLTVVHGFTRATGLYKLLYDNREAGSVLVFDDCDSVFSDETSLNILKAALDTTHVRTISWHSERNFKDDEGNELPHTFEFEGSVIFVTNLDFDRSMGSKLGPHLAALISRSYYLDLNMRSQAELLERIDSVVRGSEMLESLGLSVEQGEKILTYIHAKTKALREISLRTVVKLANIVKASGDDGEFERVAKMTCCKPLMAV